VTDLDPYARSLTLCVLGLAAVIYAAKLVWRVVLPARARPFWLRAPLRVETVLVGMATLILVMAPVHMADWRDPADILDRWARLLPVTAAIACAAGLLSGVLDRVRPIALGLGMAWPSALYAVLAWAFFLLIRSWVPPEDLPSATELAVHARPFLFLVTAFPVASLLGGIAGGASGRAFVREP
jgi:hypothetical protein